MYLCNYTNIISLPQQWLKQDCFNLCTDSPISDYGWVRAVKTAPEFEFPVERKALTVTSQGLSAKGLEFPSYGWQLANQGSRGPKGPRDQGPSRVFSAFSCSHTESECHIEMLSNSHIVMRRRAESCHEKLPNLKRSTCWLNLAIYRRDFYSNLFSLLCSV